MNNYSKNKLLSFPHLASFNLTTLITELGLYEPVVIDTAELYKHTENLDETFLFEGYKSGKDVAVWNELFYPTQTIMLPCAYCGNKQAYNPDSKYPSPMRNVTDTESEYPAIIFDNRKRQPFQKSESEWAKEKEHCEIECKKMILEEKYFSRSYCCALNPHHKIYAAFVIEDIEIDKIKDNEDIENIKGYVILKKIGQYPSMADMQFFESSKYKKLLKNDYKDYTMALGLYASGVGCGSFLYLRRLLEYLVEKMHQECKETAAWNDEEYINHSFNDKIKQIESTGRVIIPNSLNPVRSRLYGVLSKGVHSSSEEECKDLFPLVKIAIDMIMDNMLAESEQAEKIKNLEQKIASLESR